MTPSAFRIRLALALGLPLSPACQSTETPAPVTPMTPAVAPTTTATSGPCKLDEIHERVCGLVDESYEGSGGFAKAPYAHCTLNALSLWDVSTNHVLDGWKIGTHDKVLASFKFDAAGTAAFKYDGSYQPDDPRCCYQRCNPLVALAKPRANPPAGMKEYELCVPSPVGTKFPAAGAKNCPAALRSRNWWPYGKEDPLDDAPFLRGSADECCYNVASNHRCPPNTFEKGGECESPSPGGRPLREAGKIVTAPTRMRGGWHVEVATGVRSLAAAAAWAREAAFEHASVAAFARLAIDLMVHGAPAELVDAAHVAARDEIRHAQLCYGIASAFGGEVVGPGRLALADHAAAPSLEDLAVECFRDGCVNETIAALAVVEASRVAAPALRETLASIADDEIRHSELSFRILAWALANGGTSLRARIAAELDALRAELAEPTTVVATDHDPSIGILSASAAAQLRRRVIADVILPCAGDLLA